MPQAQFSVDSAVRRLREFSELTEHRMGLKPREARRVHAAFQLLATGPPSDSKRTAQSIDYFEFLQRVKTLTGNDGIVLCAAGLVYGGVDPGSRMLPPIEPQITGTSFSGDVYELTVQDVQGIATMPDQITGKIRLTETYNPYTPSFIIIPISNELTNRLIINRPRVI
ncbi:hypothetical protein I7I51_06626 [Histoplasma capsulatum]|uniref:Uncharacterized protein n=1 Tax=Ajellomyces capsulatus TaxID=5037 RepID=A0A8A1MNY9_AJECA|nr:predicted protein [Histoplasma mississippiense (nom. inval.)]EDN06246.1 predicted protein [Histoplasma mississippiense (nom. inval.)]QSS65777.1 hypothetical protein I7I51_06626 [Histoplasma capsulatum]